MIHAEEVIPGLDDVIDLDGFVAGEDFIAFVEHFHLISSEPIAGHAVVAVDHVDL